MPAKITYEWIPDPGVFAAGMFRVSDALRNPAAPLLFAAKQMHEEIKASFLSETSPDGKQWQYWEDSYAPVAESYPNVGILRRDELLYEAAIDEDAFIIDGDTLFYDTSGWPYSSGKNPIQYGWVHQDGSEAANVVQRQFVGLSHGGQTIIEGAFMEWFDNALALYVTKGGALGIRGRSSLGTFVGMEPAPFRPGRRR